jgi:biopolymer transport protein ExbD
MKIARKPMKADVPSVAMGDIAFNLLIFFVILARAQDDSHVKWQPAQAIQVQPNNTARVSVAIDIGGHIFLNGKAIGEIQLASAIKDLLGDQPAGKRTVLLKVDRSAPAEKFEPVIEAISQAGGEMVHVLNQEKK